LQRSKFEMYVDILSILARGGPLKLTHMMNKSRVNCSTLKGHIDFLLNQGLVEECNHGKVGIVFAVTPRGITTLKYFNVIKQVLPGAEENRSEVATATTH
jgi:predicted transcriptional regulator